MISYEWKMMVRSIDARILQMKNDQCKMINDKSQGG